MASKRGPREAAGSVVDPGNQEIQKIVRSIQRNMQKLDELGCPSVWFGYSGAASTSLFSPQMIALEDDTTFKNLVVSAMMNNLSPPQLRQTKAANDDQAEAEPSSKEKKGRKRKYLLPENLGRQRRMRVRHPHPRTKKRRRTTTRLLPENLAKERWPTTMKAALWENPPLRKTKRREKRLEENRGLSPRESQWTSLNSIAMTSTG